MNLIFSYRGHNIDVDPMVNGCIWNNVLKKIKKKVSYLAYATWFEESKLSLLNKNVFVVTVPTRIQKKMLDENYKEMVIECLKDEINNVNEEQKEIRQNG